MRAFALALCVGLFISGEAAAQAPARGNFVQRMTGWFQPRAVKDALRAAKQEKTLEAHDAHLTRFVKANAKTLPLFSVIKLAKATHDYGAHEQILSVAATAHAGKLSFAGMKDLAKRGTTTYPMQNRIAAQVLKQNTGSLSLRQQAKLDHWANEVAPPPSSSSGPSVGFSTSIVNGQVVSHTHFGLGGTGGFQPVITTSQNLSTGDVTSSTGFHYQP